MSIKPLAPSPKSSPSPSVSANSTTRGGRAICPARSASAVIEHIPASPIDEETADQALATLKDCISSQYGEAELVKRFFERIWADVAGTEEQAKIHPNFVNWLQGINVPEETSRYLVKIIDQGRRGLITKTQFIKFGGEKMAGYFNQPNSARSGGGKASSTSERGTASPRSNAPERSPRSNASVASRRESGASELPSVSAGSSGKSPSASSAKKSADPGRGSPVRGKKNSVASPSGKQKISAASPPGGLNRGPTATKESPNAPTKLPSSLANRGASSNTLGNAGANSLAAAPSPSVTVVFWDGQNTRVNSNNTTNLNPLSSPRTDSVPQPSVSIGQHAVSAPAVPSSGLNAQISSTSTVNGAPMPVPAANGGAPLSLAGAATAATAATKMASVAGVTLTTSTAGARQRDFFMDEFEKLGTANKLLESSQQRMLAEMQAMRSENQDMKDRNNTLSTRLRETFASALEGLPADPKQDSKTNSKEKKKDTKDDKDDSKTSAVQEELKNKQEENTTLRSELDDTKRELAQSKDRIDELESAAKIAKDKQQNELTNLVWKLDETRKEKELHEARARELTRSLEALQEELERRCKDYERKLLDRDHETQRRADLVAKCARIETILPRNIIQKSMVDEGWSRSGGQ